jgi:hypothetical protein
MDIHDLHTLIERRRSIRGYDESRYGDDAAIASFVQTLTLQGAYGRRGTGD